MPKRKVMESKAKLFGHPIHPILIVFPLGLFATAAIFDVMSMVTENSFWTGMAYYLIYAGIIGGLAAAIFGFIDFLAIPQGTRAKAIGLLHGVGNVIVVALFIGSCLLRRPSPNAPPIMALTLSFTGVALSLMTGWLGGELVDRLGVGVDQGAHLNAPNSLSGRPASEQAVRVTSRPNQHYQTR